jgi:2-polyprenyl-3-methyl-5-hydroxy-6-metoxy-1,4-benzoquinol methylase
VAEHVPDPLKFWNEVAGLLKPGAVAILQTPVECHDYDHPFKERPDFFDEVEHLFLFTDNAIRKLTAAAQLQLVALEDARASLGQICVLRKP